MEASRAAEGPLRIEVATSQIEGGQAIGWVDPDRVTGCVAFSEPREAFERFVAPHIADEAESEPEAANVPPGVSALIAGLRSAHHRLYRENHSLMKEPKWVTLTGACAEESRIYFVKTRASWVYLLRGGRACRVGGDDSFSVNDARGDALGGPEKLRLQVTSIEIEPDDQILLVMGDTDDPPDERAIARLFTESRDLKRACDGLVNLLGLQGASASVVAFRYSPLMADAPRAKLDVTEGRQVIGEIREMARELVLAANVDSVEAPEPLEVVPRPSPPAARGVAAPTADSVASEERPAGTVPPSTADPAPAPPPAPRRRRGASVVPIILIALLLFAFAALLLSGAGWPDLLERVKRSLPLGVGGQNATIVYALVDAESNPAGARLVVDGQELPGRTPVRGLRVRPGRHEVKLVLGVAGVWCDSLDFVAGERQSVSASFVGSLHVDAREMSGNPRVWLEGQVTKRELPADFSDLPAGWYRIYFEDDRMPLWERKVLVRHGEQASVEVNNAFATEQVLLRVEGLRMIEAQGLRPSVGDSVFVDGSFAGLSPLELEIDPGLHGVRVASGNDEYCEVLRLPAGASRFVVPQFGLRERPRFHHVPPGRVAIPKGPVLLAVEIRSERGGLRRPELQLPAISGGPRAIPLIQMDSTADLYVGKVEVAGLVAGQAIAYYFSVTTPEGDQVVSDLYRFVPVDDPAEVAGELSALTR